LVFASQQIIINNANQVSTVETMAHPLVVLGARVECAANRSRRRRTFRDGRSSASQHVAVH